MEKLHRNNHEPIKVSDWSQKWKLLLYCVFGLFALYFFDRVVSLLTEIRDLLALMV